MMMVEIVNRHVYNYGETDCMGDILIFRNSIMKMGSHGFTQTLIKCKTRNKHVSVSYIYIAQNHVQRIKHSYISLSAPSPQTQRCECKYNHINTIAE